MALEFDDLTTAMWIYDIDNYRMFWANAAALVLWESDSLDELIARDFKPETSNAVQESLKAYQKIFQGGGTLSLNWAFTPGGVEKTAFCQLSGFVMEDGRTAMLVEAVLSDLLHTSEHVVGTVLLSTFQHDGTFVSANPAFLKEMGNGVRSLERIILDRASLGAIYAGLASTGHFEGDVVFQTLSGDCWYHLIAAKSLDKEKNPTILLNQYDIHQRKMSELALEEKVYSDPLTRLLNRRGLAREMECLHDQQQDYYLCYLDLDGFKLINDSFGHAVGDEILQAFANRLSSDRFAGHIACRFGGDEFILVIPDQFSVQNMDDLANILVEDLSGAYQCHNNGSPISVSASIGVARFPDDAATTADIILCADAAMYQAKRQGKRRWVGYEPGMEHYMRRQSILAQHLCQAESNDELDLHYQPIWDVASNTIVSFEALLRWTNPELGYVPADEVIQVAEEVGIIYAIENWVIRRALADLVHLRAAVAPRATISVNISGSHFAEPSLPDFLTQALSEFGLQPEDLIIELTESTLLANMERGGNSAACLKRRGIAIAIDDFGTGYSSLAYLHQIPASTVKIDRSFVQRIQENGQTVKHIQGLIRSLGMHALAEGVETLEQQTFLQSVGIVMQQGFLLGKPKPLADYL